MGRPTQNDFEVAKARISAFQKGETLPYYKVREMLLKDSSSGMLSYHAYSLASSYTQHSPEIRLWWNKDTSGDDPTFCDELARRLKPIFIDKSVSFEGISFDLRSAKSGVGVLDLSNEIIHKSAVNEILAKVGDRLLSDKDREQILEEAIAPKGTSDSKAFHDMLLSVDFLKELPSLTFEKSTFLVKDGFSKKDLEREIIEVCGIDRRESQPTKRKSRTNSLGFN
jgi:hypothetical protein